MLLYMLTQLRPIWKGIWGNHGLWWWSFPHENWLSILTLLMFLTLATKAPVWAVVLPLASFPRLLWYCGVSHSDKLSGLSDTAAPLLLDSTSCLSCYPSVCYTLPDTSHLKCPPCLPTSCSPSTQFQETLRDTWPFPKDIDNGPISYSRSALITFLYSYFALIPFIVFSLLGKTI